MIPKIFIGPMSLNIVDASIEYCEDNSVSLGLIPSRRQVEYEGGYTNHWTTEEFAKYVKSRTDKILLVRDHAGPDQGDSTDDGLESLKYDCKFFDTIHIDPWKKYPDYQEGLNSTVDLINFCYKNNPDINFEVGTEESIRKFSIKELRALVEDLKLKLKKKVFEKIQYLVIQSGTSLEGNANTGVYDKDRLIKMVNLAHSYGLLPKEHNGDYLSADAIKEKMSLGLDSINIAPEFGLIETQAYIDGGIDIDKFWQICHNSKRWEKWVGSSFNPLTQKEELIKICGHYVLSSPDFLKIKPNIDLQIKTNIKQKLNELCR